MALLWITSKGVKVDTDILSLQFDLYQRYKRTQEIVSKIRGSERLKILDVGGGENFISRIFPEDETFILDTHSSSLENYTQGDGRNMEFEDNSFDVVTSLDVYEHLPKEDRFLLFKECNRVSKRLTIVAAPFGTEETVLAENMVQIYCREVLGRENAYLAEHNNMSLPQTNELEGSLDNESLAYLKLPSNYIYNWIIMMMVCEMVSTLPEPEEIHAQINKYYNTHFYSTDNREPCYRYFYILGSSSDLKQIEEKPCVIEKGEDVARLIAAQLFLQSSALQNSVVKIVSKLEKHIEIFQRLVKEKDDDIANLQEMIIEKDGHISNLQKIVKEKDEILSKRRWRK